MAIIPPAGSQLWSSLTEDRANLRTLYKVAQKSAYMYFLYELTLSNINQFTKLLRYLVKWQ